MTTKSLNRVALCELRDTQTSKSPNCEGVWHFSCHNALSTWVSLPGNKRNGRAPLFTVVTATTNGQVGR
jgi:hypothetical protein